MLLNRLHNLPNPLLCSLNLKHKGTCNSIDACDPLYTALLIEFSFISFANNRLSSIVLYLEMVRKCKDMSCFLTQ